MNSPASQALDFWHRNEDFIVWSAVILGGLWVLGSVYVTYKAVPVAMKLAASKYPLLAAAL